MSVLRSFGRAMKLSWYLCSPLGIRSLFQAKKASHFSVEINTWGGAYNELCDTESPCITCQWNCFCHWMTMYHMMTWKWNYWVQCTLDAWDGRHDIVSSNRLSQRLQFCLYQLMRDIWHLWRKLGASMCYSALWRGCPRSHPCISSYINANYQCSSYWDARVKSTFLYHQWNTICP